MARRRHRRHHRRFGDMISVPLGLGRFKVPGLKALNPLKKSVNSTDVLVGAALGIAGGSLVRKGLDYAIARFWPSAPVAILNYSGPISSVLAGALALTFLKNKHKATGYFVGATLIGLAPIGWNALAKVPFFSDYVSIPGVGGYGLLVDQPSSSMGLLVDEGSISGLAAYAMGNDESDAYVP